MARPRRAVPLLALSALLLLLLPQLATAQLPPSWAPSSSQQQWNGCACGSDPGLVGDLLEQLSDSGHRFTTCSAALARAKHHAPLVLANPLGGPGNSAWQAAAGGLALLCVLLAARWAAAARSLRALRRHAAVREAAWRRVVGSIAAKVEAQLDAARAAKDDGWAQQAAAWEEKEAAWRAGMAVVRELVAQRDAALDGGQVRARARRGRCGQRARTRAAQKSSTRLGARARAQASKRRDLHEKHAGAWRDVACRVCRACLCLCPCACRLCAGGDECVGRRDRRARVRVREDRPAAAALAGQGPARPRVRGRRRRRRP